jgi:hypothetical protein
MRVGIRVDSCIFFFFFFLIFSKKFNMQDYIIEFIDR